MTIKTQLVWLRRIRTPEFKDVIVVVPLKTSHSNIIPLGRRGGKSVLQDAKPEFKTMA